MNAGENWRSLAKDRTSMRELDDIYDNNKNFGSEQVRSEIEGFESSDPIDVQD